MTDINELIRIEKEVKEAVEKERTREEAIRSAALLNVIWRTEDAMKQIMRAQQGVESFFNLNKIKEYQAEIEQAKNSLDEALKELELAIIRKERFFTDGRTFFIVTSEDGNWISPGDAVNLEGEFMKVEEVTIERTPKKGKLYRYLLTDIEVKEL